MFKCVFASVKLNPKKDGKSGQKKKKKKKKQKVPISS